jgi:hypothetical protein
VVWGGWAAARVRRLLQFRGTVDDLPDERLPMADFDVTSSSNNLDYTGIDSGFIGGIG